MSTLVIRYVQNIQKYLTCLEMFKPDWKFAHFNLVNPILESLGRKLRNTFYMPLNNKIDLDRKYDQIVAAEKSSILKSKENSDKKIKLIDYFNIYDRDIEIPSEDSKLIRTFKVRFFESINQTDEKIFNDKNLRIILFTFNGNTQSDFQKKSASSWDPLTMDQLSHAPLHVIRELQKKGIEIDSLMTTSLGNIALDNISSQDSVPSTIIINRGFTSSKKIANQLFFFPLNYVLYGVAKLCGWLADPEKGLLNFLKEPLAEAKSRKIILIEVLKDFYFSDKGALDPNFYEKIVSFGASIFRAQFWPFFFHYRSHHALPLKYLKNNSLTKISTNSPFFSIKNNQRMSAAIVQNIFLKEQKNWHTCFCVGGADSTLDIGMLREVKPLLKDFIRSRDQFQFGN